MIYALLAFILIREGLHWYERKKLLEMIMAKSLPELKEGEKKPTKPQDPVVPPFVPLDTASDEQFEAAIRKENGTETLKDRIKNKLRRKDGR